MSTGGGTAGRGYLVLEHAVDEITITRTVRTELGDLTNLTASIQRLGLLCPIVITVDGVLISGRRRLEVMRRLGHSTVPVWVAAGISDELRTLLAIQDDNLLHKDLTATEKAALYTEYKALLAEENARRQAATRFGATPLVDETDIDSESAVAATQHGDGIDGDGGWESQPPSKRKSRVQAAHAVTGRDSSQQLEQVLTLQRLATSQDEDARVRQAAAEAVVEINADGKVHGRYLHVMTLRDACWLEKTSLDEHVPETVREEAAADLATVEAIPHPRERARAARGAVARIRSLAITPDPAIAATSVSPSAERDHPSDDDDTSAAKVRGVYHARRLVEVFARVAGWWDVNDPTLIGTYASEEQWALIVEHRTRAASFLDAAEAARAEALHESPG